MLAGILLPACSFTSFGDCLFPPTSIHINQPAASNKTTANPMMYFFILLHPLAQSFLKNLPNSSIFAQSSRGTGRCGICEK
jgi:hypothetical protein